MKPWPGATNSKGCVATLLLLHLLKLEQGRGRWRWLLCSLDEDRPVFGDGHVLIEGGRLVEGRYLNGDVELAVGTSAIDASCRRDVRVVATDCGSNMPLMSN